MKIGLKFFYVSSLNFEHNDSVNQSARNNALFILPFYTNLFQCSVHSLRLHESMFDLTSSRAMAAY